MDDSPLRFWTDFLGWGTLFHAVLLLTSLFFWRRFRIKAHDIHGRLFGVSDTTVDITAYATFGLWKILALTFFLIPWVVLLIRA